MWVPLFLACIQPSDLLKVFPLHGMQHLHQPPIKMLWQRHGSPSKIKEEQKNVYIHLLVKTLKKIIFYFIPDNTVNLDI